MNHNIFYPRVTDKKIKTRQLRFSWIHVFLCKQLLHTSPPTVSESIIYWDSKRTERVGFPFPFPPQNVSVLRATSQGGGVHLSALFKIETDVEKVSPKENAVILFRRRINIYHAIIFMLYINIKYNVYHSALCCIRFLSYTSVIGAIRAKNNPHPSVRSM